MSGERLWYFKFGRKMGKLLFEMGMIANAKPKPNSDAGIRTRINDIKEHTKELPQSFPYFAGQGLKEFFELLDRFELLV